jgi:hypothetical protein
MPTVRQFLVLAVLWALVAWLVVGGWTWKMCPDPDSAARWCDVQELRARGALLHAATAYYVVRAPIVGAAMGLFAAPSLTACTPRIPNRKKLLLQGGIWSLAVTAAIYGWHLVTETPEATLACLRWAPLAGAVGGLLASPMLGAPVERRVPGWVGRVLGVLHDGVMATLILALSSAALVLWATPNGFANDNYGEFDVSRFVQTWTGLFWESQPIALLAILLVAAIASDRVAHLDAAPSLRWLPTKARRAIAEGVLQLHHGLIAILVMLAGTTALLRVWPHGNRWDDLRMAMKWTALFWSEAGPGFVGVGIVASLLSRLVVARFAARPSDVPAPRDALGDEGTAEIPVG